MNSDDSATAVGGSNLPTVSSPTTFKPTENAGGFHPLPFLFKDVGLGMVAEVDSGKVYAYKRVELEVDLTEPLHNLLDDLLPYSPTDLEDVILLMCGRKQLSLSTTFQDFTYHGINGSRAKVKLDLLWDAQLQPNNRAGGRVTGGQTIINIDDLYRIVDEADPLYWLNTTNVDSQLLAEGTTGTSSGRSTNSTTLLNSQYIQAGRAQQTDAGSKTPLVATSHANASTHLPPLSPPSSGAQMISPTSHATMLHEMMDGDENERNHHVSNTCDLVQQRDLASAVAGDFTGGVSTAAVADSDASTAALTPSSGAGAGSISEGGRRSRGSHRSGASFCGSLPSSSTGNALFNAVSDSSSNTFHPDQDAANDLPPRSDNNNTAVSAATCSSRKRRRKPLHATSTDHQFPLILPIKTEQDAENFAADRVDLVDAKPLAPRRRVPGKRSRRSMPAASSRNTKPWQPVGLDVLSPAASPFVKVKSASPSADYLMSVSRMFSGEDLSGMPPSDNNQNQLFPFPPASLLSPRLNNIVVEPREVHTAASITSSADDAAPVDDSAVGSLPSKPASKRRTNKKPRRLGAVASAGQVKVEPVSKSSASPVRALPEQSVNLLADGVVYTPCGIKKKRTIGANSYYAYNLGQTFDAVGKNIQLWQYLLELLMDPPRYQRSIEWMDATGTFTLKEPERVAFLWGERKGSKKRKSESMSYENMSRALRYYYGEILDKVPSKQFTYRFINLRERIGHEPDELFGFARARALSAGLQLPSSGCSSSAGNVSLPPADLPLEPRNSPANFFTFPAEDNGAVDSVKAESSSTNVEQLGNVEKEQFAATTGADSENTNSNTTSTKKVPKRNSKRKKPNTSRPAEDSQQSSSGNVATPEPTLSAAAQPLQEKPTVSISSAAFDSEHFSNPSFTMPSTSTAVSSSIMHAQKYNTGNAHFPQLPMQQPAMIEMVRNADALNTGGSSSAAGSGGGGFNPHLPQNISFLLQQLASQNNNSSHNNNNNANSHGNFPSAQPNSTSHFGAVPSALEEALLRQQQQNRNAMPPSQQEMMLNNNSSQLMPPSTQTQMLAQLFQQHQQQQQQQQNLFLQQQQQRQNNAILLNNNNTGVPNCITLPGVGTINLASLIAQQHQQQQVAPASNSSSSLNNALMSAVLAASSSPTPNNSNSGGGGLNIADGMRNLLAKVAEGGSQVNQLMAAVGLATLLSSAQQQASQQPQQVQAQPSVNNNCIAQVFALLQQQQQQQNMPATSSGVASGAAPVPPPTAACAPFGSVFGLRF